MEQGAIEILRKHGCLYMKDDYKALFEELEDYYKPQKQVKNIAYEPVLASVFVIKDTTGDWVRLCKTQESAEEQLKVYEKEHSYAGFYIDEEQLL